MEYISFGVWFKSLVVTRFYMWTLLLKMLNITHLGKVVGHLRADHTFITHRKPIHFFRKYQGFGLSYAVIKQLRARGCLLICLIYTNDYNEDKIYFTTPENIINKGIRYTDKQADRQFILPLKDWHAHTP